MAQTTIVATTLTIKNIMKSIMAIGSKDPNTIVINPGMVTAKAFNHWTPPSTLDVVVGNVGQTIGPGKHNIAMGSIIYVSKTLNNTYNLNGKHA